jgi:DNA-binding NarL/FixJ family response regulator
VRVIVADDVLLTREGIVRILEAAGVKVVGTARDVTELLDSVRDVGPDAAVVDIRMPPTYTDEGLTAATRIRHAHPQVAVLLLSQYVEASYALRLLEDQPERVGYLLKERIFDRVVEGETVIDPTIVAHLMGRKRRDDPLADLTPREREVLGLVAEGLSNAAIAERLVVTERTVEAHIKSVLGKLGLEERSDTHRRVLAVLTFLRG